MSQRDRRPERGTGEVQRAENGTRLSRRGEELRSRRREERERAVRGEELDRRGAGECRKTEGSRKEQGGAGQS